MDQKPEMQGTNPPKPQLVRVPEPPIVPQPESPTQPEPSAAAPLDAPAPAPTSQAEAQPESQVDSQTAMPAQAQPEIQPENSLAEPSMAPVTDANNIESSQSNAAPATGTNNGESAQPGIAPAQSTPKPKHHHHLKKSSKRTLSEPVSYVRRPILLVILLIFLILIIAAGAGLAAWYFLCYNRPDRVAYDAINYFLSESSVVVEGAISTKYDNNSIQLTLQSDTHDLTGSSKATLSISALDANGSVLYAQPYQVEIGSVLMSSGDLYVRIDELANAIDQYMEDHALTLDQADLLTALAYQSAKVIDGQWWQISIPDLIELYSDSFAQAEPGKELYACIMNVLNRDVKGELAALYREHQFIHISRVKPPAVYSEAVSNGFNSLYQVEIDYNQLANFINAIPSSDLGTSVCNCLNRYYSSTGSSERASTTDATPVTAEQLEEQLSSIDRIELEITNFSHQLAGITVAGKDENHAQLNFRYQPVTVAAPARYHSFSELIERLAETISQSTEDLYTDLDFNPITGEWELLENDLLTNDEVETI